MSPQVTLPFDLLRTATSEGAVDLRVFLLEAICDGEDRAVGLRSNLSHVVVDIVLDGGQLSRRCRQNQMDVGDDAGWRQYAVGWDVRGSSGL